MPMSVITQGKDKGWSRCEICGALIVPDDHKYAAHLWNEHRIGQAPAAPRAGARSSGSGPSVFISHSHADRIAATRLQRVLEAEGGGTYLDQDQIQVADVLPERIRQGIEWCDAVLLLWSARASASRWVHSEWNMAYDLRKKIIPYCLDPTPLPPALDNLVFVSRADESLANGALLKAVFGRDFAPNPTTLFPGKWRVVLDAFGFGTATYDLDLRANGQITGIGKIDQGGVFRDLVAAQGLGRLLDMQSHVTGSWTYESGTEVLTLNLTAYGMGQTFSETIQVQTTGRERGSIQGQDFSGRTYKITRVK